MKRIDPQAVAAWFKAHPDIQPITEQFVEFDDEIGEDGEADCGKLVGCCGLMSRALADLDADDAKDFTPVDMAEQLVTEAAPRIARVIGIEDDYAIGFSLGWDRMSLDPGNRVLKDVDLGGESLLAGYDDGKSAFIATMETFRP